MKSRAKTQQLVGIPPAVSPIVEAARRALRTAIPEAEEVICQREKPRSSSMMWKLVRYVVDGRTVATIGTFTKHASVFFARGSELDDGHGLLEGAGKNLRYITLRTPADAKRGAVKEIVRKAFVLAEDAARRE